MTTNQIKNQNSPEIKKSGPWKVARTRGHLFNQQIKDQLLEAVSGVLFNDCWGTWDLLTRFEEQFGQQMGYRYVAAVQSGSAALLLAMAAAGLQPGDEVITVANSDQGTTGAISHLGATPVLCDVLASDYTIDPERVEELITPRTRGLLPVSLYGHPADVRRLRQIADRHGLFIVEDDALATAARDYGEPVGRFADLAIFSTIATKQLGSAGLGGLVVTEKRELWEKVQVLKGYGLPPTSAGKVHGLNDHVAEGWNLRMVPMDAAVLSVKLPYLAAWTEKRKQIARWYEQRLSGVAGITLPTFRPESEPVRREFALRVEAAWRPRIFEALQSSGIQVALNYCPPAHQRPIYRDRHLPGRDHLPITEQLGQELLALPIDPLLEEDEIAYVCDVLVEAISAQNH